MISKTDSLRVKLVPWLSISQQGDAVTLISGMRALCYRGAATRLLPHVLPFLDGRYTSTEIAAQLGSADLALAIEGLCNRLVADRFAIDVRSHETGAEGSLPFESWVTQGSPTPRCSIYVVGGAEEYQATRNAAPHGWVVDHAELEQLVANGLADNAYGVVWVTDRNAPALAEWNQHAYHSRFTWLPINHFDGEAAIVGPLIVPPETACFECYRRRRAAAIGLGSVVLDARPAEEDRSHNQAATHLLAAIAVLMLHGWAGRADPYIPGAVHTVVPTMGLQGAAEYVLRVPRCPACRPVAAATRLAPWSEYLHGSD